MVVTTATNMPPNEGMAMGTMMSEPLPELVRIGISARIVVAVVIIHGRIRFFAPSMTAVRISSMLSGVRFLKL